MPISTIITKAAGAAAIAAALVAAPLAASAATVDDAPSDQPTNESAPIVLEHADYDLAVTAMTVVYPAGRDCALPGETVDVAYTITNVGDTAVNEAEASSTVSIDGETTAGEEFLVDAFHVDYTALAPGESYSRTATVTIDPDATWARVSAYTGIESSSNGTGTGVIEYESVELTPEDSIRTINLLCAAETVTPEEPAPVVEEPAPKPVPAPAPVKQPRVPERIVTGDEGLTLGGIAGLATLAVGALALPIVTLRRRLAHR